MTATYAVDKICRFPSISIRTVNDWNSLQDTLQMSVFRVCIRDVRYILQSTDACFSILPTVTGSNLDQSGNAIRCQVENSLLTPAVKTYLSIVFPTRTAFDDRSKVTTWLFFELFNNHNIAIVKTLIRSHFCSCYAINLSHMVPFLSRCLV